VQLLLGARPRPLRPLIPGGLELWTVKTPDNTDYTVQVSYMELMIIVITIVLMAAFTIIITRTSLGRAQRACEQDQKMASLLGINVNGTIAATFVIAAVLAAVAGLIYTLRYGSIDFFIGFLAGVKAFTAAVLGGIGSLPGAMLGGVLIGLIETFFAGYAERGSEYKDVAVFMVLVVVLIFRPTGLLGKPDIEKV
jgi:branched-chain amino acid transport system permease protein